jgi:actin-like ATPase involved in cell morphogenesis
MTTRRTSRALVLDLGTRTLRLAFVTPGKYAGPAADGAGALLEMPALTLIDQERRSVVAVGTRAAAIAGGTLPTGVVAARPLRDGQIVAFDAGVALVRAALHEAMGGESALRRLARRPRVLYSLPSTASDVERRVMRDVLRAAGFGTANPVPAAVAAGVGAELPVQGNRPRMICNIGAGRAEIAVLAGGKVTLARGWPLGGDWFDQAIVRAVRRQRGITIPAAMAEESRREFGALDEDYDYRGERAPVAAGLSAGQEDDPQQRLIAKRRALGTGPLMARVSAGGSFGKSGRNPHNRSGLPEFRAHDVESGLAEGARALIERLAWFWEDLDPATRTTVEQDGLTVAGGAAQLPGLTPAIGRALGIRATLAADAAHTGIRGLIELGADRAAWRTAWGWPPEWEPVS